MKKEKVTGIILAGGKSSRMGRNKALIEINEKPMIAHVHGILKNLCDEIIISANETESYNFLNEKIVSDEIPGLGPIGGIYSCLKKSSTQKNLVLACDIPFISKEFLIHILLHKNDAEFVLPVSEKYKPEPLCAIYDKSIIKLLEQMIGKKDYKIQNLVNYCSYKFLHSTEVQFNPLLLKNINTPQDL